jgi:hypothetical protein
MLCSQDMEEAMEVTVMAATVDGGNFPLSLLLHFLTISITFLPDEAAMDTTVKPPAFNVHITNDSHHKPIHNHNVLRLHEHKPSTFQNFSCFDQIKIHQNNFELKICVLIVQLIAHIPATVSSKKFEVVKNSQLITNLSAL